MKKQSKYRYAHTAVGASGLALIMGLVNVAVGAEVKIAVPNSPIDVGNITVTSNAATSVGTPQFFRSQVTAGIVGSPVTIPNAEGNVTVADNTLSAAAGGNEALAETIVDSYTDIGDLSISSAQVSVLDDSDSFVNASLDSELVTIQFSAPVSSAVVTGNIASADVAANRSIASIDQDSPGFAAPVNGSAEVSSPGFAMPHNQVTASANGVIANYQHTVNGGTVALSGASVTDAAILVDVTAPASSLGDGAVVTISDNQVIASYGDNDASSQYEGIGTSFDGSLIIANYQDNRRATSIGPVLPLPLIASVAGSGVTVDLGNNAIDGDVTITGHGVWADSSGNTAANIMSLNVVDSIEGASDATANTIAAAARVLASADNSTLGIASAQRNQGVHLESTISDSHITVNGNGGEGAITLHDNRSQASTTGNTAENTLLMSAVSAIDGAGAVVATAQLNSGSTVIATNDSNVGVTGPGGMPTYGFSTHAGPVVFSTNNVGASAVGNTASNLNQVVGGDIDSGTAVITSNSQFSMGGNVTAKTTSDIGATQLLGEFNVTIPFVGNRTLIDGAESADMVLAGNTIDSSSKVNVATNSTLITAGSGEHSGAIANQQVSHTPSSATTLGTLGVGLISVDEPEIDVTLSGNTISAWASGNEATSELFNHATTRSGVDIALNNNQTSNGEISSEAGTTTDPLELGITVIGHVDGTANVLGNRLKSVAVANSARNAVELEAVTALGTADNGVNLNNTQTSESALTSTTEGSVLLADGTIQFDTGIPIFDGLLNAAVSALLPAEVNGNVNIIDNRLQAFGTQNEAFNTLEFDARTTVDGTADLSNTQTSSGSTNVSAISGGVGVMTEGFFGGGSIDGAVTVTDNKVQTQAIANLAGNTLSIVSGTGSTAGGSLTNTQTNQITGAVDATTTLNGRIGITASGSLAADSTVTVGGNSAVALAFGNNASNALNANGGAGVLGGNLTSASMQSNAGAITSNVTGGGALGGPAVGLTMAGGTAGAYTANVLGSTVSSAAYGNSAQNALNALSTGGMVASATLISSQSNTGAVTAHVSNAGVGIIGSTTGSAGAGRSVIAGNTISATAVGNSSVSQMVIGR